MHKTNDDYVRDILEWLGPIAVHQTHYSENDVLENIDSLTQATWRIVFALEGIAKKMGVAPEELGQP